MWSLQLIWKLLFAGIFVVGGIGHFRVPDLYQRIIPPQLPQPRLLVYVSGLCEIALGLLLLCPGWSRLAGWGLIALLIAVFPANVYMALHPELFPRIPVSLLWLRLPLQGALIAWAYHYTKI